MGARRRNAVGSQYGQHAAGKYLGIGCTAVLRRYRLPAILRWYRLPAILWWYRLLGWLLLRYLLVRHVPVLPHENVRTLANSIDRAYSVACMRDLYACAVLRISIVLVLGVGIINFFIGAPFFNCLNCFDELMSNRMTPLRETVLTLHACAILCRVGGASNCLVQHRDER